MELQNSLHLLTNSNEETYEVLRNSIRMLVLH
jgi:hypothetical protein